MTNGNPALKIQRGLICVGSLDLKPDQGFSVFAVCNRGASWAQREVIFSLNADRH